MLRIAGWLCLVLLTAFAGLSLRAQAPSETKGPIAFLKLLDSERVDVSSSLPLPEGAYRIGDGISAPKIVEQTDPEYPDTARQTGLESAVMIAAVIEEDGSLSHVQVTGPLGFGLDEKAVETVSKWKFKPGAYKGYPVATFTSFAVDFRIPHNPSRWHLLGLRFKSGEGGSPPRLKTAPIPHGPGISSASLDEGQLVAVTGRLALVTLSFDIDTNGAPANFNVENASEPLWGKEALSVVKSWRFQPAMVNSKPVSASGEIDLAWGPRDLPHPRESVRSAESGGVVTYHPPLVSQVAPLYTFEALARNIQDSALISMTVGEDGVPRDPKAEGSLGYGLDQKAIEAVSMWRFRPIVSGGKAIAVPAKVWVPFKLPESFGNVVKPKPRPYKPILTLP